MDLNADGLAMAAAAHTGYPVSPADAALLILSTDVSSVQDAHSGRVQWAIWDKTSTVNGAPPNAVLGRLDHVGGEVYLIWVDGDLVVLQPHHPETGGAMTLSEAQTLAAQHAGALVNAMAMETVVAALADASPPPAPTVTLSDVQAALAEQLALMGPGTPGNRRRRE